MSHNIQNLTNESSSKNQAQWENKRIPKVNGFIKMALAEAVISIDSPNMP